MQTIRGGGLFGTVVVPQCRRSRWDREDRHKSRGYNSPQFHSEVWVRDQRTLLILSFV